MFRKLEQAATAREASRARLRRPLGDLDPLVRELVGIGTRGGFLDSGDQEARTRRIGLALHRSGGMAAMVSAHEQVASWVPCEARALEQAWDGVGDWLG